MPNLLFVTCHLPYPLISGGRRREYELLTRLVPRFGVHLVAITKTYGEDVENSIVFEDVCESVAVLPAELSGSKRDPLQVRKHSCPAATATIDGLIARHDIDLIHVEAFYMMQHIPPSATVPVFLQEQNIEYLLWKQRAQQTHDPKERATALWEYLATLEMETSAWERADLCGALTAEDFEVMQSSVAGAKVRLVPDGCDHLARDDQVPGGYDVSKWSGKVAVFVGNFAYQPNIDAARHLVDDIWPYVLRHDPAARLILVGNAPPPEVEAFAKRRSRVEVTGRVPDVTPYLDIADVFLCPLRIGGGIKVKVLEALCRGKPIVTTSVGAQGIPGAGSAMVVADDPREFARATVRLLRSEGARDLLAQRARERAELLPTWDDATGALVAAYETLLASTDDHTAPRGSRTAAPAPRSGGGRLRSPRR